MSIKRGDLVACYLTNTEVHEELLQWGIVLDVNEAVGDIQVLDNGNSLEWWPSKRWRLLKSKKSNNSIDLSN